MKTKINIVVALGLAALTFSACGTKEQKVERAEENVRDAKEDVQDANLELQQAQQQYRDEAAARITENERSIDELRGRMKDSKEKVDAEYSEKVNKLEEKNKEMDVRLKGYNDTNKDKWEEFKREFNHDMDELGQSLKDLGRDNKK
jgi:phage-related minor tail protein